MTDKLRKLLFWTHLALGLAAGLFFLVMCATGVLVAYRPQLETILNHWGLSSNPAPGAQKLSIENLTERVRENTGSTPRSITVYPDASQPVDIDLGGIAGTVYADAHTGEIVGRPSTAVFGFFARTMSWHTALGLNGPHQEAGTKVLDAANLVCFLLILAGLYLWLPRQWTWRHVKAVLLFRPGLAGKARDFNWHNVIGFWTLIPLAVMVWSGIAISYRWAGRATLQAVALAQSRPQVRLPQRFSPAGEPGMDRNAEPDPFQARVAGLSALVERAKSRLPEWGSISFNIPESMASPVTFSIDPNGYGLIKGGMSSQLQLARSGEELGFRPPSPVRGRGIYRFAHTGELWGQWGQTVGMLGCLGGVFLVWTGFSLSIHRFWAWLRRSRRWSTEGRRASKPVEPSPVG